MSSVVIAQVLDLVIQLALFELVRELDDQLLPLDSLAAVTHLAMVDRARWLNKRQLRWSVSHAG